MVNPRHFVYLIRSERNPSRRYVGLTSDPAARLKAHNAGLSTHTAKNRPWRPVVVVEFDDPDRATAFEAYLKSGSGRAFSNRHFW